MTEARARGKAHCGGRARIAKRTGVNGASSSAGTGTILRLDAAVCSPARSPRAPRPRSRLERVQLLCGVRGRAALDAAALLLHPLWLDRRHQASGAPQRGLRSDDARNPCVSLVSICARFHVPFNLHHTGTLHSQTHPKRPQRHRIRACAPLGDLDSGRSPERRHVCQLRCLKGPQPCHNYCGVKPAPRRPCARQVKHAGFLP